MAGPPDPQVLAALLAMRDGADELPPPAVGDVVTRRRNAGHLFNRVLASRPPITGVEVRSFSVESDEGSTIGLRWYRRSRAVQPGSAAL
jgi:hypothetical protein